MMGSLIWAVAILFFSAVPVVHLTGCFISACRLSSCDGYWCTRCKEGYYLDTTSLTWRHYCKPCPTSCHFCDGYEDCSGCNVGHYGYRCQSRCAQCCKDNTCEKQDGACTNGTTTGYYRETDDTCSQCPPRCSQCSSSTSCSLCNNENYWGEACQYTCEHCSSCSKSNGCSDCIVGYYKIYKKDKGGYECLQCPGPCTKCINNCQDCSTGYWGAVCENACGQCLSCSKSYGCNNCKSGYYRVFNNNRRGYECKQCPNNCLECTSNTACSSCVSGYWGSYCQHSCSACLQSYCSEDHGCTFGCKDGYFLEKSGNENYCEQCLSACKTCSDSVSCSSCPSGYNGTQCQFDCTSCNGGLCNSTTGKCTYLCATDEYFKMDYTRQGCFKCPGNCSSCSSANRCTSCIDGYFGNLCPSKCLFTCKSCANGYTCDSCAPGYFSRRNNNKCECNKNKCSKRDGNMCQECSDNTWYPDSDGCCPCSANCKDNVCSADSTCVDCIDTKYGSHCEWTCNHSCNDSLCYQNGSCISCKLANYFGPSCSSYCPWSLSNCFTCYGLSNDTLTCTQCRDRWFADGNTCTACSDHCITSNYPKCDPSNGACKGTCETGWFGDRCDIDCNVTKCKTCSNEDKNICNECKDGYYSESNSSCVACPDHCLVSAICDKRNGSCSEGCEDNWSGDHCDTPCPINCRQCDQFNKSFCLLCKKDFYGDSCANTCNSGCGTKEQFQTCNKNNGTCNWDCKASFWDAQCDKQCGEGCSRKVCNRMSGHCLSPCDETHFGQMCDSKCSENCNDTAGRSCNETNGYCLNNCHVGWFGGHCHEACSKHCKGNNCDRNNGSCTSGCIDGYTGLMCMTALLKDDSGSNTAAISGGVGAGVAFLVVLVVIVMVFVLRRRLTRATTDKEHNSSVATTNNQASDETCLKPIAVYQNLMINTADSNEGQAHSSEECTSTYQELDQETRVDTKYSTLDEITPSTEGQANNSEECTSTYQELDQETRVDTKYSTLDEITPSTKGQAHNSGECTSTYQELDQESRVDTGYSTLDAITQT